MNVEELGFQHCWVPAPQAAQTNAQTVGESPTLLLLHGTGGSENDLIALAKTLCVPCNLLSPRGRVLENGMARFFRRFDNGAFDEDDLKTQTHDLAQFVADAAHCYGFDASCVVALGFSDGANIASSLLLLAPQTLCGAMLLRAMVPLKNFVKPQIGGAKLDNSSPDIVKSGGAKVFLASGEYDPIVPVENARRLASLLRENGAHVTHEWEDAGHNLTNDDIEAMREWLAANFG